jgi:spore coat protein CotH
MLIQYDINYNFFYKKIIIFTLSSFITLCGLFIFTDLCNAGQLAKGDAGLELFLPDTVAEVRLELSDEAWQAILDNPLAEEYQSGNIIYNGIRVDHVAIRTKGNSSLTSVASFFAYSDRYSFKVDMNRYIKGQDLLGLQKLNLNNGYGDATLMREHLSYELMRALGLPTPRTAFVNLYVNNKLLGLYTAVEAVDDEFIKARFEENDGDLYKAEMGSDLLWKGNSIDNYPSLELKTNEDTSDHSALLTMLHELNYGRNYESLINVDAFLRYLAVSTALVNLDSYQGIFAQNYYLYEEKGVFTLIPWDLNLAFGGLGCGTPAAMIEFMIDEPTNCKLTDRPLIAKLLQNPGNLEAYHRYLDQLITGPLDPDTMEKTIEEAADLIREYVYKDPTKFFTNEEFEQALTGDSPLVSSGSLIPAFVSGIIPFVRDRVACIRDQLNNLTPASGDGLGNCSSAGFFGFGGKPISVIENISPSQAKQGDTDVAVTITLMEELVRSVFPPDTNPLNVKIGTLEGRDICRNEMKFTAIFDIPADEPPGMKDVSIEFPFPDEFQPQGEFSPPGEPLPPGVFQGSGGLQLPDEFQGMGEFQPPDGFLSPAEFQPPGDFQYLDGLQPPAEAQPPEKRDVTFTKSGAFEILAGDTASINQANSARYDNGDLNEDGTITPADALVAFRCYLGSDTCPDGADVNKDGSVTPADALCLFKKYLGQPSCLDLE